MTPAQLQHLDAIDRLAAFLTDDRAQDLSDACWNLWLEAEEREPLESEHHSTLNIAGPLIARLRDGMIQDLEGGVPNDPFLRADVRWADLVEEIIGRDEASEIRQKAMTRWATFRLDGDLGRLWEPWCGDLYPGVLYDILPYAQRTAKQACTASREQQVPAISLSMMERIGAGLLDRRRTAADGPRTTIFDRHGSRAATLPPPPAVPAGALALKATQTLGAHRLLAWLIVQGSRQASARLRDFRTIRVRGGLTGLARELGLSSRKAPAELQAALQVMQHVELELPWGTVGGLLTWSLQDEAPGRPAELRLVVGELLLPGYVRSLPKGGGLRREARMLVPIPERIPSLSVPAYHQAAAARLHLFVLCELRFHATQLVRERGVRIPPERWRQLAEEADLPPELLEGLLASWESHSTGFLERSSTDPDLWTLSHLYGREKTFIEAAGLEEERGRLRQQRSRKARDRASRGSRGGPHREVHSGAEGTSP